MARAHRSPEFGVLPKGPVPVSLGGTSSTDIPQAVATLMSTPISDYDTPSGLATTDSANKLKLAQIDPNILNPITLSGPKEVQKGSVTDYEITNYDSHRTYTCSVSAGSVRQVDNIVRLTAPTSMQTLRLTVNGKVTSVVVMDSMPVPPAVITPTQSAQLGDTSTTVTLAAFDMESGSDVHQATDWQLSVTGDFTSPLRSVQADPVNLLTWNLTELTRGATYYVRARFRGAIYGYGNWSRVRSFTVTT